MTQPRVTIQDLESYIRTTEFELLSDGKTTLCILHLINGFTIVGKSSVVSKENYQQVMGEQIAREDAIKQMWPLLGFALADRLYRSRNPVAQG